MQILDDQQKQVMSFIAAVNRGGHRPSVRDVEEWLARPKPRLGARGPLIKKGRPAKRRSLLSDAAAAVLANSMRDTLASTLATSSSAAEMWTRQLNLNYSNYASQILDQLLVEDPGEPDEYGPPTPPESLIASLERLGWLSRSPADDLAILPLGAALLRSDDMREEESEVATAVLLGADDHLSYPRLIHRLAEAGEGAVIDPYLRFEQLAHIATRTSISRVLVGEQLSKADRAALAVFVEGRIGSELEVRVAKRGVLHDRLIVCDSFVDTIGTSMNTVGKQHPTILTPLPSIVADTMRNQFESWWAAAEVLARSAPAQPPVLDTDDEEGNYSDVSGTGKASGNTDDQSSGLSGEVEAVESGGGPKSSNEGSVDSGESAAPKEKKPRRRRPSQSKD